MELTSVLSILTTESHQGPYNAIDKGFCCGLCGHSMGDHFALKKSKRETATLTPLFWRLWLYEEEAHTSIYKRTANIRWWKTFVVTQYLKKIFMFRLGNSASAESNFLSLDSIDDIVLIRGFRSLILFHRHFLDSDSRYHYHHGQANHPIIDSLIKL